MKYGVKNQDQTKGGDFVWKQNKMQYIILWNWKKKKEVGGGEYQNKNKIQKLFTNVQQTVEQYHHDHKSDNS